MQQIMERYSGLWLFVGATLLAGGIYWATQQGLYALLAFNSVFFIRFIVGIVRGEHAHKTPSDEGKELKSNKRAALQLLCIFGVLLGICFFPAVLGWWSWITGAMLFYSIFFIEWSTRQLMKLFYKMG